MTAVPEYVIASVPPRWPGSTIVCIGSGPSLTADDLAAVTAAKARRNDLHILAINDAVQLIPAPTADVIIAPDAQWWAWKCALPDAIFPATRYTLQPDARQYRQHLQVLNYRSGHGIEDDPTLVRTGGHSGYLAINVARHLLGDSGGTIILLGYDMQPSLVDGKNHFFGEHPGGFKLNYDVRLRAYDALAALLAARQIAIINCSRQTAITTIDRGDLADVL